MVGCQGLEKIENIKYQDCQVDGNECWNNEKGDNLVCMLLECSTCLNKFHLNSDPYIRKFLECPKCGAVYKIMEIQVRMLRL